MYPLPLPLFQGIALGIMKEILQTVGLIVATAVVALGVAKCKGQL